MIWVFKSEVSVPPNIEIAIFLPNIDGSGPAKISRRLISTHIIRSCSAEWSESGSLPLTTTFKTRSHSSSLVFSSCLRRFKLDLFFDLHVNFFFMFSDMNRSGFSEVDCAHSCFRCGLFRRIKRRYFSGRGDTHYWNYNIWAFWVSIFIWFDLKKISLYQNLSQIFVVKLIDLLRQIGFLTDWSLTI